jgi:protein-S-isoprenylcysteine O-methyltransferase Ste14
MLLGTGLLIAGPVVTLAACVLFIAGTEIRVGVEDRLLASRFGERFHAYRNAVPAYIPFLR